MQCGTVLLLASCCVGARGMATPCSTADNQAIHAAPHGDDAMRSSPCWPVLMLLQTHPSLHDVLTCTRSAYFPHVCRTNVALTRHQRVTLAADHPPLYDVLDAIGTTVWDENRDLGPW